MKFQGKVAMITGASVGIGRAVALCLAEQGADLVLLDVNAEKLLAVSEETKKCGCRVLTYECDVSDENRVNEVAFDAIKHFGKIDILVNNAALWRDRSKFAESSSDLWKRYIDVNIMGVYYCTRAVIGSMIENHYGKIINVSSVAGVYGNANMVHYSATKGAVITMTKALAKEVADKGVLVNCVSPGSVSSSQNEDIDYYQPSELSFMGRTGTDRENANLICFLASDEASYISGQNIQIDGCRKKM
ncbi:MAG: SDR family NAD(P)-dependent oxidoreductase [Oscillospiraceae bacterium]|nr:SDR family NAD(P)-dependent oxidoreductase [Oscillospiraceae bacterium]